MASLEGKVAIVTGGGSGIGKSTAQLLAERGCRVVVGDINGESAQETADLVTKAGGEAIAATADMTSQPQVQDMVGKALTAFGAVHILHNNAGINRYNETLEDLSIDLWRHIIETNLTGYFIGARTVYPIMKAQGGGVVINTSSGASMFGHPHGTPYASAKFGVNGMTLSLAGLVRNEGIRVNAVLPNARVETPQLEDSPTGREALKHPDQLLKPIDVARAVAYVAAHDTLTGVLVTVDFHPEGPSFSRVKPASLEPLDDVV